MSQWAALLEANKENIPFALGINPYKSTTELGEVTTEGAVNVPSAIARKSAPPSTMEEEESAGSSHVFVMPMSSVHDPHDDLDVDGEDNEITSRKEKSLGLLCQRFLVAMNEETRSSLTSEVHLETVARKMSVEKRRIYDIVNVMEALDAMSKTNKSYYRWHGLEGLPKLMADLQKEAVEERLPERVLRVEQAMCSFTELSPGSRKSGMKEVVGTLVGDDGVSSSQSPTDSLCQSVHSIEKRSRVDGRDRQGRNSLAQLCRRFLMVLLSNPKNTRRVSLDVASTVLIKDPDTEGFEPPSRSRCRRLYDIANVLVALGLIKKVHYLFGTKKIPLFVYCGPEPDENSKFDVNACIERLSSNICSTPSTPIMKVTASTHQSTSLGKRSSSEANIRAAVSQKLPRLKSEDFVAQASSSLMMFAELAAERLRQETEFRLGNRQNAENASSMAKTSYSRAESDRGYALPRPQAQHSYGNFSISPMDSPLANASKYAMKVGNNYQMSTVPMRGLQQIALPTTPVWTPVPIPNFMRIPPEMARSSCPVVPRPVRKVPVEQNEVPAKLSSVKHTVTNILGVSNKVNTDPLNHRNSSPFQVVKKPQKQPFGSLHNIPNSH